MPHDADFMDGAAQVTIDVDTFGRHTAWLRVKGSEGDGAKTVWFDVEKLSLH